jgi:hypothetical protein
LIGRNHSISKTLLKYAENWLEHQIRMHYSGILKDNVQLVAIMSLFKVLKAVEEILDYKGVFNPNR